MWSRLVNDPAPNLVTHSVTYERNAPPWLAR
jgi:hypothetical protein